MARIVKLLKPSDEQVPTTATQKPSWARLREAARQQHADDKVYCDKIEEGIKSLHADLMSVHADSVTEDALRETRRELDTLRDKAQRVPDQLREAIRSAHRIAKRMPEGPAPLQRALGAWLIRSIAQKVVDPSAKEELVWSPHLPEDAQKATPRAALAYASLTAAVSPWGTAAGSAATMLPAMLSRTYKRELVAAATGAHPAPRPHAMDASGMLSSSPVGEGGKADERTHKQQGAQRCAIENALAEGRQRLGPPPAQDEAPAVDPLALVRQHRAHPCENCASGTCTIVATAALASAAPAIYFTGRRPAETTVPPRRTYPLSAADAEAQARAMNELVRTGRMELCAEPRVISPTFITAKHHYTPSREAAQEWFRAEEQGGRAAAMDARVSEVLAELPQGADAVWSASAIASACARASFAEKGRLVFDYTTNNERSCSWPMRMTTIEEILAVITPGAWIASDDVASGFHHITVVAQDRPYMAVIHLGDGKCYQPTRLMFGARTAPGIFCAVTAELAAAAQRYIYARLGPDCGIFLFVYVDDIFTIAQHSRRDCLKGKALLKEYLKSVGVALKEEKSREPAQDAPLLGLRVDTRTMRVYIPEDKRYNNLFLVRLALSLVARGQGVPASLLRKLVGKLAHFLVVFPEGRAHMAPLYAAAEPAGALAHLSETPGAISALSYWSAVLCDESRGMAPLVPTPTSPNAPPWVSSFSDAAGGTGFCLTMGPIALWGTWTPEARAADISVKEFYPIALLEELAGGLLQDITWAPRADNIGVCFAVHTGHTRGAAMAPFLAGFLASRRTTTPMGWLPRQFNTCGDDGSKAPSRAEALLALAKYKRR